MVIASFQLPPVNSSFWDSAARSVSLFARMSS
jgi:hypothetical protein